MFDEMKTKVEALQAEHAKLTNFIRVAPLTDPILAAGVDLGRLANQAAKQADEATAGLAAAEAKVEELTERNKALTDQAAEALAKLAERDGQVRSLTVEVRGLNDKLLSFEAHPDVKAARLAALEAEAVQAEAQAKALAEKVAKMKAPKE